MLNLKFTYLGKENIRRPTQPTLVFYNIHEKMVRKLKRKQI